MQARCDDGGIGCGRRDLHLTHRPRQVLARLRNRRTHSRDHLDGAFEEFLLDLRVLLTLVALSHPREDLRCHAGECAGIAIDQGELDLDTEAGPRGCLEVDHVARLDAAG